MTHFSGFSIKQIAFYVILILTSFLLYSISFYPLVNSDHVLNVLIAHDYSLPADVYCWDQDRGGTFIPLISQFFIKGFGMNALLSVSISNYLILTLGFIGFSQLLTKQRSILLLAIIWFFPYQRFIDINVFPIGMSYSLIGFSIIFILRINFQKHLVKFLPNLFYLGVIFGSWLAAVWVSDLIFISLIVFGLNGFFYILFNRKKIQFNPKIILSIFVIFMVVIYFIINYLKTYATAVTTDFGKLNSFEQVLEGIGIMKSKILEVLLFEEHLFTSIGAWLILGFMIYLIIYLVRNFKNILLFKHFWSSFFLSDFAATLLVILLSHWVLLNEMGRWYFIAPYISCALFILLIIDRTEILSSKIKFASLTILLSVIGVSSITSIIDRYGEYKPMSTTIRELNQLGEIGVIGDFWDSYRMSMVNPDAIKSTAYEHGGIRNFSRVSEVFNQPKIILTRDMWMDSFPDSIQQFGVTLLKQGEPFFLGGSNLCEYKPSRIRKTLALDTLIYNPALLDSNLNCLKIDKANKQFNKSHIVYGAASSLLPGKYEVNYYCSFSDEELMNLNQQIAIDISANYGNEILHYKPLKKSDYIISKKCFTTKFSTNKLNQATEFRLMYNENLSFYFYKIEIIPLLK